jgi:enoyl-CoA hydratase/carnithine racemase
LLAKVFVVLAEDGALGGGHGHLPQRPLNSGARFSRKAFQALSHHTEDHREAVNAFLEKRAPEFKGR